MREVRRPVDIDSDEFIAGGATLDGRYICEGCLTAVDTDWTGGAGDGRGWHGAGWCWLVLLIMLTREAMSILKPCPRANSGCGRACRGPLRAGSSVKIYQIDRSRR